MGSRRKIDTESFMTCLYIKLGHYITENEALHNNNYENRTLHNDDYEHMLTINYYPVSAW